MDPLYSSDELMTDEQLEQMKFLDIVPELTQIVSRRQARAWIIHHTENEGRGPADE